VIRVEVSKLVRRPRTWVSIGLLCLLPTVVAIFVAAADVAPRPGQGPPLLSAVLNSGSLFPAAALALVLPLFLPIAVSVVAGDSVAGEANAGTLRYLLIRPAGRTRLLVAKLVTLALYVLLAVVSVAAVAYIVGTQLFGSEPVATSVSGGSLTPQQIAIRTALAMAYIGWSMMGVASVSFFLSTVSDSSLGAALGALAALVMSQVLVTLDAASSIAPYLPTRYWLAWIDLYRDPLLWHDLQRGVAVQAVYVAVLLSMAWANFATKDVTS
jgi:ABC-2 type transport system permease protein